MPLFLHQASVNQADAVAETLKTRLLHVGGLTATEHPTGQQWDAPNGWAPLEWMAVKGLEQYGHHEFAADIARRGKICTAFFQPVVSCNGTEHMRP